MFRFDTVASLLVGARRH